MNHLNLDVLRKYAGLSPMQFAAILAPALAARIASESDEKPDVMLRGLLPAVGATNVMPRYVGGTAVQPFYPGRVGAPAQMQQAPGGSPINYSPQEYVAGDVTDFGLGRTTIAAGATGTSVTIRPPRPFTPQMLTCPSTVQGLLIKSISIAGTNINCGDEGTPIERYSEVSQVPQILFPTIDPSTGVVFVIANPTADDLVFSGSFYGTQVRV